jgi:hypothetical protein
MRSARPGASCCGRDRVLPDQLGDVLIDVTKGRPGVRPALP